MALNATERGVASRALLECFGEDYNTLGRFLAYLQARGNINLLADVAAQSNTYQPFLDAGLSLPWWQAELTRIRDITLTGLA